MKETDLRVIRQKALSSSLLQLLEQQSKRQSRTPHNIL